MMNYEPLRPINEVTVIDPHTSHTLEALRIRSDGEILDVPAINLDQLGSKEEEEEEEEVVEERGVTTITEALTEGALDATESKLRYNS